MAKSDPVKFSSELQKICGVNLLTVILYGSAASGNYSKQFSDYNTLVLLKNLGVTELKKMSGAVRRWVKDGNPAPLLFTWSGFRDSAEVFPLEFHDIQSRHQLLYGADPLQGLTLSRENLRLELEHEIKGKLIHLRKSYLLTEGHLKKVRELMAISISTFVVFFKGVFWMLSQEPPVDTRMLLAGLTAQVGVKDEVFLKVWQLRDDIKSLPLHQVEGLLLEYLQGLDQVVDFIDKYKGGKK